MNLQASLLHLLRDIPDFPKPGIVFKDITPLLAQPGMRKKVVEALTAPHMGKPVDALVAVEARGFIFGSLVAQELNVPFIPVRKAGKLPYRKIKEDYALEYGTATLEMHEDAIHKGMNVLIHDDVLATGGTALAAAAMVRRLGGEVAGFSFLINLGFLPGRQRLVGEFGLEPHYLVTA
ncbi:MAG: adenine phosphoribosyltransferase [Cyclobacteriaceae bacterium]|jgi:adenine phosphoribosyltransferase|nr:adenine phosphoribosyltransferase [Cyclobacteriaceae bacterium]